MNSLSNALAIFALGTIPLLASPELFVDGKAAGAGDGSTQAPFQTINEALNAVSDGVTTVTVKGGTYHEVVEVKKGGSVESPLLVRAAPGERVVLSGFRPLTGWKEEGNGLYSLQSEERITDLFVNGGRQRVARFPDDDQPWIRISGEDPASRSVDVEMVPELGTDDKRELYALVYSQAINSDLLSRVTEVDASAKRVTFGGTDQKFLYKAGDALVFLNGPSFVNRPGEWCCVPLEHGWKVFFRPQNAADLEVTQTRKLPHILRIGGTAGNYVTVEGFEITGGLTYGVYAAGGKGLKISKCLVYANGSPGGANGIGIRVDRCEDFTLESSIIFANHANGIGFTQGSNILIKGCEITANDMDGIVFSGRNNMEDDPLRKVVLEKSYIHRHFYLGHPDNSQIHSNVRDVTYKDNLLYLAGQNVMIQQCEEMVFTNNVMFGATARHVILGHGNSNEATFTNNTFAFANHGAIGTAGRNVSIRNNVFFENVLSYESDTVKGDGNLFWTSNEEQHVLIHTVPSWKRFTTPQEFAVANESEANSKRENPQFKNVPELQVIGKSTFFEGARNTVFVDEKNIADFAVGDTIEINGDGVARQVETAGGSAITFKPELPTLPFRNAFIWKWPSGHKNLAIDLTSPVAGAPQQPGAAIDFAAYQRGELDGSGKRSLPVLSPEAAAAMPSPDIFVYPFCLPLEK